MSDDTGILSLEQAADALMTPADDEQNAHPTLASAAASAQPAGADVAEDEEIDREAPEAAAPDPTNAEAADTGDGRNGPSPRRC